MDIYWQIQNWKIKLKICNEFIFKKIEELGRRSYYFFKKNLFIVLKTNSISDNDPLHRLSFLSNYSFMFLFVKNKTLLYHVLKVLIKFYGCTILFYSIFLKARIHCETFLSEISWNTVSGVFHETWNNFMKYFYPSI